MSVVWQSLQNFYFDWEEVRMFKFYLSEYLIKWKIHTEIDLKNINIALFK